MTVVRTLENQVWGKYMPYVWKILQFELNLKNNIGWKMPGIWNISEFCWMYFASSSHCLAMHSWTFAKQFILHIWITSCKTKEIALSDITYPPSLQNKMIQEIMKGYVKMWWSLETDYHPPKQVYKQLDISFYYCIFCWYG